VTRRLLRDELDIRHWRGAPPTGWRTAGPADHCLMIDHAEGDTHYRRFAWTTRSNVIARPLQRPSHPDEAAFTTPADYVQEAAPRSSTSCSTRGYGTRRTTCPTAIPKCATSEVIRHRASPSSIGDRKGSVSSTTYTTRSLWVIVGAEPEAPNTRACSPTIGEGPRERRGARIIAVNRARGSASCAQEPADGSRGNRLPGHRAGRTT